MPIRTFIALELAPEIYSVLAGQLAQWKTAYPRGINWVRPENLHQTLLFLGDTDPEMIPSLEDILDQAAEEIKAQEIQFTGFELFPLKQPRMIWAQLRGGEKELTKVNRLLLHKVRELGLEPDDKPLRLHITMGRIKAPQSPIFDAEILKAGSGTPQGVFDTITLYQSVLKPEGPTYTILKQIKLA